MANAPKTAIIKEVYDGENSPEIFEQELDKALENDCDIIIIEPNRLADETAQWIRVGNCLHKTAVVCGLSSICISKYVTNARVLGAPYMMWWDLVFVRFLADIAFYRQSCTLCIPLTVASVVCTGLYTVCWQCDPCCKYQVAKNLEKLNVSEFSPENLYYSLLESAMNSNYPGTPVILVKKVDKTRKILRTVVAVLALTVTVFRISSQ